MRALANAPGDSSDETPSDSWLQILLASQSTLLFVRRDLLRRGRRLVLDLRHAKLVLAVEHLGVEGRVLNR